MTNQDVDFETWFDIVAMTVLDRAGFDFNDMDSVQADYDAGRDAHDVADEVAAEYLSDGCNEGDGDE